MILWIHVISTMILSWRSLENFFQSGHTEKDFYFNTRAKLLYYHAEKNGILVFIATHLCNHYLNVTEIEKILQNSRDKSCPGTTYTDSYQKKGIYDLVPINKAPGYSRNNPVMFKIHENIAIYFDFPKQRPDNDAIVLTLEKRRLEILRLHGRRIKE